MTEWRPIETAPKDGTPFLALNHDLEVWVSKYEKRTGGRIMFRMNGRRESTTHVQRRLADGATGMVLDAEKTKEEWRSDWTFWSRLYEFEPTHWMPLPPPPA